MDLGNQNWETPDELFDKLNDYFKFTIDGAASQHNTKCVKFISEEQDAHRTELSGEIIFTNPTYRDMEPWQKTFKRWRKDGNTVVILCQDRTDTIWFRSLWDVCSFLRFPYPRINFVGTVTGNNRGAAVFVLLPGQIPIAPVVSLWAWKEEGWS